MRSGTAEITGSDDYSGGMDLSFFVGNFVGNFVGLKALPEV
jgi:hypothetical protein